jgi:glyoxylase-like metal-dependent hydrolase (beta-lactamase superfamily II)
MQIVPGVLQVNGTPYGRPQNSYFVHVGDATVIVDSGDSSGYERCLPEIERNAERWGLSIDRASYLLLTHEHFDHSSHAAAIQARGVRIVASAPCVEAIAAGDERCLHWMSGSTFDRCVADDVVGDGDEILVGGLTVRCVSAPGHSNGCLVYELKLNGEICWFVGDLVDTQEGHDGVELGWAGAPDYDRQKSIATLRSLLERPCDHLFPGHGHPVIGGAMRVVGLALEKELID